MARLQLESGLTIPASTQKTIQMYAPAGFHILTSWFNGETSPGNFIVVKSAMIPTGLTLTGGGGSQTVTYQDGSAASAVVTEGWEWKVKNTSGSGAEFLLGLLVQEDLDGQTLIDYASPDAWPITIS